MKNDFMDITYILGLFKKQWKIIVGITVICVVIAAILSYFVIRPKYETEVKLFVGKQNTQQDSDYTSSSVQMYQNLMKTYAQLATTRDLIKDSLIQAKVPATDGNVQAVLNGLTVTPSNDTQILDIKFVTTDKTLALPVINAITNQFMLSSNNLIKGSKIHIIGKAQAPTEPISPNKKLNIIIGFIIGIILSIGTILVLDYFDNTVKDKKQLEKLLEIPVIGSIPMVKDL